MFKDKQARQEVTNLKETLNLLLKREGLEVRSGEKRTYIAKSFDRSKNRKKALR